MIDMEKTKDAVMGLAGESKKVRELAEHFLLPEKDSKEAKDNERMAAAAFAVEVVVSLVNVFSALRNPNETNTYMAISDMTIGLNTNVFWVQNAPRMMPLLIAAVNAQNDARELELEGDPAWISLAKQARNLWLEILPHILFLVHGQFAMRSRSVEIKKAFAGILGAM